VRQPIEYEERRTLLTEADDILQARSRVDNPSEFSVRCRAVRERGVWGWRCLATDNGLPLGIAPDSQYTETTLRLAPGETLTFLSDGVVEARNARGELFGFERAAAISGESAESIAQAAQQFGQEDDITVLTLSLAPAEVSHV
jgi:serine/threonine protein phosphatase PrpC